MTLQELIAATAGMPASTPILVASPWGELEPAQIITIDDLCSDDPLRDQIPSHAIVFACNAD